MTTNEELSDDQERDTDADAAALLHHLELSDDVDNPIPAALRKTRPGFPELWGMAELMAYADGVAARLGREPLTPGRAWTWDRLQGFPEPVARLSMANVYLAHELKKFVDDRYSTRRFGATTPIDAQQRAEILHDYGLMSAPAAATKHGVSLSTVKRIWQAGR